MVVNIFILYFPGVELLDFAGPLQTFHEARDLGAPYVIRTAGTAPEVTTAQGLTLSGLDVLPQVGVGDLVLVPGFGVGRTDPPAEAARWLAKAWTTGATLVGTCTGAFLLGQAGILDGKKCTTHWKRTAQLQEAFPRAKVQEMRLFVEDGRLFTSGGLTSGIDLALHLVDRDQGPLFAARVAQELVVYIRRDGSQTQKSPYLEHRNHLHPGVHRAQDAIVKEPGKPWSLEALGNTAGLSPRHLSRAFRESSGISVHEYLTLIRLDRARSLLEAGSLTVEAVASEVGFSDGRQLRRLWQTRYGTAPRGPNSPTK